MIITGEGRPDWRTLAGDVVAQVAGRSARAGVPCAAVVRQTSVRPDSWLAMGSPVSRFARTEQQLRNLRRVLAAMVREQRPGVADP
jgi:glycerate kinase